jgi:hypothetical protein
VTDIIETGAYGFTVEFIGNADGTGQVTIKWDAGAGINKEFALAGQSPEIAAEMIGEGIAKGGLSYLQFSYIVGLLVTLLRKQARRPRPGEARS